MIPLIKRKIGLELEFTVTFCIFLTIVMFSCVFYLTSKQKIMIGSIVSQKGESISNLISKMIKEPFLSNNKTELNHIVKTALEDDEIIYLFIEDTDGNILNTFTQALNIQSDKFALWGIDPDDQTASLSNLLNNIDIYPFEIQIGETGNSGKINMGLSKKRMIAETRRSLTIMIVISIIVIILMSYISYFMFSNLVSKPLKQVIGVSKSVAKGDLRENIEIKKKNEIGDVADTINQMTSNLKSMVMSIKTLFHELETSSRSANDKSSDIATDINKCSSMIQTIASSIEHNSVTLKELSSQTNDLKSSSEDTSASILELVSSSGEIANNMDVLVGEIDDITISLEQISSSLNTLVEVVDIVSESAEDTSTSFGEIKASIKQIEKLSEESRKLIVDIKQQTEESGLPSINETIEGMKKIRDSVELTGEVIYILDSKSMEIDKILRVISEVTDRTTLLSLNAAILAAQAGQHGKSFAVVASEIKNLAEDTSSSTQEISDIINMIQKEIKTAVQSMGKGISKVAEGFNLAEEAGKIFNEITVSTQKATEFSEKIYTATQEQSAGLNLMAQAIQSIDERIGGLLVFVKEQKTAMDKMLISIKKMRDVAHQVKSSTDEQRRASSEISDSAENVSSMSSAIAIALNVLSGKSAELLEMVENIKQNTQDNVVATTDMSQSIKGLLSKASVLKEMIGRFHV